MAFDLIKLLTDVFDPQPGEVVTVACDVPRALGEDTPAWQERRAMAAEWQRAFTALGRGRSFAVRPLFTFRASGANGAELPAIGSMAGQTVPLRDTLLGSTLAVLLTEYSATAPLDVLSHMKEDFRAASMPGVEKRMERTALSADHHEVARRCKILEDILRGAVTLEVAFSTGHRCSFDLRFRKPEVDDGVLPRFKPGDRVINLPSGETFIVPYEGEQAGSRSQTAGMIPVRQGQELMSYIVEENRIVKVEGNGPTARTMRAFFAADPARTNIAEVAFGCNEWAQVTGNVLEDEKAGFHWAYGRSDHLGGVTGVAQFIQPDTVVHQDVVYAKGNPIQIAEATAVRQDGSRTRIIRNGAYVVF
ncbi:MAG: aminopeptidase [Acidobacteriia bacterium]|nr:aminopeptidase [Terriglobia bacterium]